MSLHRISRRDRKKPEAYVAEPASIAEGIQHVALLDMWSSQSCWFCCLLEGPVHNRVYPRTRLERSLVSRNLQAEAGAREGDAAEHKAGVEAEAGQRLKRKVLLPSKTCQLLQKSL